MEVTVCDRCGKRIDLTLGGNGRLYCDTAFRNRAYDLCAVCCRIVEGVITGDANKIVSVVKMGEMAEKA